jgi:amino acid permease
MEIKEYFDKIPTSTKIVGAILIGVIVIFLIYFFSQQKVQTNAWKNYTQQQEIDAAKAKRQKENDEFMRNSLENVRKMEQEQRERQILNELDEINQKLDRR